MGIVLRCTGGPCAGQTITIDSELLLGRDEPDPGRIGGDPRLSRRHCRLFVDDDGCGAIEDLGSTNGTWVNDERLSAPRPVETGDILRVGQTTFEIEIPVAAATQVDTAVPTIMPTVAETPPPPPQARLLVVAGSKEGEEIPLDHELLIGRSYGEPGALGGDRRLSRRHARIARGPGGVFYIEDTGSSNGTMLNHARLRGAHSIKDGDEIEVGSTRLEAYGLPAVAPQIEFEEEAEDAGALAGLAVAAPPPVVSPPPAASPPPGPPPVGSPPPAAEVPLGALGAAAAPLRAHYSPQGAAAPRLSHRRGRVVAVFAAVFALALAAAVAVVVLVAPLGTRTCPSGFVCQKPLTAPPLRTLRTFTGSLGWRVEYDASSATPATVNAAGNELALHENTAFDRHVIGNSGSPIIAVLVRGYRSTQVSPQAALHSLASTIESHLIGTAAAPSSDRLFGRPVLGFHPAIGEVLEGNAQTPQGPGGLIKLALVSAASGGVTVVMAIVYPVQVGASQGSNPDRPLDTFGDQILGTVRFPSDGAS
jgi:pSer/pThr/pTyr-binding forkhead associated (FHA) protein